MMNLKIEKIKQRKRGNIIALTAYDYTFAKIFDKAGVDILLVGDSLGMVFCGAKNTKSVILEDVIYHTKAVKKGVDKALLVSDMPINTYNSKRDALKNAKALLNAGADAVKIEAIDNMIDIVKHLLKNDIAVMGHLGLTPQTALDYKVVGKAKEEADRILNNAVLLSEAGVFAIVLECVPSLLAKKIRKTVNVPTIGIGAGQHCDGQILVSYDMLGLYNDFRPKFARCFVDGAAIFEKAVEDFRSAVESKDFPSDKESF